MFRRTKVEEQDRDLGFGSLAKEGSRLINRDGSFAVAHVGRDWRAFLNVYPNLLTITWDRFLFLMAVIYFAFNVLFALAYLACGASAIAGPESEGPFLRAFFFAVQTSSTVGYGHLAPATGLANAIMVVQAFGSLVLVALGTGLIFARFSRPMVDLVWSRQAVVAPYRGITGLMFRIANRRKNQIFDLKAKVILSLFVEEDGKRKRSFHELDLERNRVSFLPLSWTVVHPVDDSSPLHGMSAERFTESQAELIVLLQGRDATTSQDINDWSSYTAAEVEFDARFVRVFERDDSDGPIRMDIRRIHETERV